MIKSRDLNFVNIGRTIYLTMLYKPRWFHSKNLSQTTSGYGCKLSMPYMVVVGKRKHRVYLALFSNIGTCYIVKQGLKIIVERNCLDCF